MTDAIDHTRLNRRLRRVEGVRNTMYLDTKGIPTIGVGHNLRVPISSAAIDQILSDDVDIAASELDAHISWWRSCDGVRQECILELCFNMGWGDGRRGLSGFRNTLAAMMQGSWDAAADGLADSKWAKDVGPGRANSLINAVRTGTWE